MKVAIEARRLRERDRLSIPWLFLEGPDWQLANGGDVLAVLSAPGRIRIVPWVPSGEKVWRRRDELEDQDDSEAIEALMHLVDVYQRVAVEKAGQAGRITITEYLSAHLGQDSTAAIYVVGAASSVELWASWYRNKRIETRHRSLQDLPE
jgi:hypothetical protein